MGNNASAGSVLRQKKQAIIVGGSYAGFEVASKIWDHLNVTIIDSNDYMEHICYSFKAMVEPDFSEKVLYPMANLAINFKEKVNFKQARLNNVGSDNTIEVVLPDG